MMCHLTDDSFPNGFVPSNFSMDLVCVLTTKEGNHILGCSFVSALIFQMAYVIWRLYRDAFGKSRIHSLLVNCSTQHSTQKVTSNRNDKLLYDIPTAHYEYLKHNNY